MGPSWLLVALPASSCLRILPSFQPLPTRSIRSGPAYHARIRPPSACAAPLLPISPLLPEIVESLSREPNLVIEAPPGAGKTTAVPLALLTNAQGSEWFDGVVLLLEPRRVAARSAATRIASLHGQPLGEEVGFRVRHEAKASKSTRLLVVTEGVLVRRLQEDPSLGGVSGVIFDEFHERSVDADLCLALCREAQRALRPALRLVVMSATLGGGLAEGVSACLGGCPILRSEGKSFPVELRYRPARPLAMAAAGRARELEEEVADAVRAALDACGGGDLLVFLPGEREIMGTRARLSDEPSVRAGRVALLPLYGALPLEAQQAIVSGSGATVRRVILATSIAESSLTVDRVSCVIDSGLRRSQAYDATSGMSALITRPVSAASAEQRAGRAGRLAPGVAFRLWSEGEHARLEQHTTPEIALADLTPLVLQLAAWGAVSDEAIAQLPWLTPPPRHTLESARALLRQLGAFDDAHGAPRLSRLGEQMASLPTHPRLGRMILSTRGGSAARQRVALALAALLDERDVLSRGSHGADLNLRVEALLEERPTDGVDVGELEGRLKASGGPPDDTRREDHVGQLLALAFPDRIAQRHAGKENTFTLSNGRGAALGDANDPLCRSEYLVAAQLDGFDKRAARIYLAAPTTRQLLRDALGDAIVTAREVYLVPSDGSVRARQVERIGALVLSQEPLEAPPAEEVRALLLAELRERGVARTLLHPGEPPRGNAAHAPSRT
ncbi:hypothetical protein AB1Y20_018936 [Prymnesium parvum]|uniref:ATP-dependent helicase HrpB n=1 Tax=Prymnesium parvum TaxID=97485 RepID=A0AB34JSM0_PRYPA